MRQTVKFDCHLLIILRRQDHAATQSILNNYVLLVSATLLQLSFWTSVHMGHPNFGWCQLARCMWLISDLVAHLTRLIGTYF